MKRVSLASLVVCVAGGALVATGGATFALMMATAGIVGAAIVLDRRRFAPVLWAGVAFTAPLQGLRLAPSLAISDVLILAAFVAILPEAHQRWRRVVPGGMVLAFGLIIGAGLLGTFFAADIGASLANLIRIAMAAAGSVLAMALWNPPVAELRRYAWLWFAGASVSVAWATVTPRVYLGRAIGLTNHPNHFGLVCLLAAGLGLGLALSSTGWARRLAYGGFALQVGGVGLSGSRAAIVGLGVAMVLPPLLTKNFRLVTAASGVVVLGAMAAIVGIIQLPDANALSRLAGGGGSAASDVQRRERLTEALASIARHPLTGEGFEYAQAAHNIYVQALVVGGPLALLSFLCLSWLILRAGLRAVRSAQDRRDGPLLAGLTAGYGGYLASGFFVPNLWDRYLWTYFGLLIVLAAAVRAAPRTPTPVHPPGSVLIADRGPAAAQAVPQVSR